MARQPAPSKHHNYPDSVHPDVLRSIFFDNWYHFDDIFFPILCDFPEEIPETMREIQNKSPWYPVLLDHLPEVIERNHLEIRLEFPQKDSDCFLFYGQYIPIR